MKKTLFIFITLFILYGCESEKNCQECDTQNWIATTKKNSESLISQVSEVLVEQDNNKDSISFISPDERHNEFLIARDTLRKNYKVKTLKWFKDYPNSWISIESNSVTISIEYCEKWCEGMPYVSQMYLVKTKSNPELLWEGALANIEKLLHIKDDWYLVKTECKGCGI